METSSLANTGASRERKKGIPWTEDEHRLFLLGLQNLGKGDWRGISRHFVKTRTPTQVKMEKERTDGPNRPKTSWEEGKEGCLYDYPCALDTCIFKK